MSEFIFKSILIAVDENPDAQKAFHYAVERARIDSSQLTIVSIFEIDKLNVYQSMDKDYIKAQRNILKEHLEKYRLYAEKHGVTNVELIAGEGDPGDVILKQLLPQGDYDLLVIGSSDEKKLFSGYFGSHAAHIVKHAPISVMVVR